MRYLIFENTLFSGAKSTFLTLFPFNLFCSLPSSPIQFSAFLFLPSLLCHTPPLAPESVLHCCHGPNVVKEPWSRYPFQSRGSRTGWNKKYYSRDTRKHLEGTSIVILGMQSQHGALLWTHTQFKLPNYRFLQFHSIFSISCIYLYGMERQHIRDVVDPT